MDKNGRGPVIQQSQRGANNHITDMITKKRFPIYVNEYSRLTNQARAVARWLLQPNDSSKWIRPLVAQMGRVLKV